MPFKGYRKSSHYGWRMHPIDKVNKFHAGVDLVKSHRAPIGAFIGGEVLYAGNGVSGTGVGGYGNVVVIKDAKGCAHVYAHLDSVSVKKGQAVSKGQTIGRQGATGKVTGSHLHYEVRKKSSPSLGWTANQENSTYDPEKYVKEYKLLKVDGHLGPETIKALQRYFGTPVDGYLSKPSLVIKAMQKWLGTPQDGFISEPRSLMVEALQKRFGTPVDGYLSKPSLVIKELQRRLNKGKL